MILTRHGNKRKLAKTIQQYFPPHTTYIEPFFGAGGMFFNKKKAKYNIINDIDDDVFNLFQVVKTRRKELQEQYEKTPISQSLFLHYKTHKETDPILKAVRFLLLSNYGLLGGNETFRIQNKNTKQRNIDQLQYVETKLSKNTDITCLDYQKLLKTIPIRRQSEKDNTFIYADPPYPNTKSTYKTFTEQDTITLLDTLQDTGIKFALSTYQTPFMQQQATQRNLQQHHIKELRTLKSRNNEMLLTNYTPPHQTLFTIHTANNNTI